MEKVVAFLKTKAKKKKKKKNMPEMNPDEYFWMHISFYIFFLSQ